MSSQSLLSTADETESGIVTVVGNPEKTNSAQPINGHEVPPIRAALELADD